MNILEEKLIKKNLIHKGRAVDFYCDEVLLPNGHQSKREYLNHPGASSIIPFIDENKIILVKQYRYPVGKITLEIPAGKTDKGETPLECITRELKEETGYTSKRIEQIMAFYPSTAFSNELLHIFAAYELESGSNNPDEDEFVSNVIMDFDEAVKMVYSAEIKDSKTIIALLYFASIRKRS
ncbi:MAG: NUDIX hydrolase [Elusimicrobiota bacterium]|jgi:ADP-ribose pyrophosphatase|nr:NUDIX hydrolase [Elusimicrobiota bacterium]